MKDSLFIKIFLIIIILLLGLNLFFSHSNSDRYSMYVEYKAAVVFKLDKQTGQIWAINFSAENKELFGCFIELGKKPCFKKPLLDEIIKDSSP